MKINIQFLVMILTAIFFTSCANKNEKAAAEFNKRYAQVFPEFNKRYTEAQRDYCSTNVFVAKQGVENFREWLLDTNHPTEPLLNRDAALYLINGRLFLIEEHIGNTNEAEKYCQESINDHNKYAQYVQSLNLPGQTHPLQPISSKEELRERFMHIERNLDVGWRNQSSP